MTVEAAFSASGGLLAAASAAKIKRRSRVAARGGVKLRASQRKLWLWRSAANHPGVKP